MTLTCRTGAFTLLAIAATACSAGASDRIEQSSAAATGASAVIVSATMTGTGAAAKATIQTGFYDSRFDYESQADLDRDIQSRTLCFVGTAQSACAALGASIKRIQDDYADGAHDTIEDFTCDASTSIAIKIGYTLVSDYDSNDDLHATRRLSLCSHDATSILEAAEDVHGHASVDADESLWAYPEGTQSFCYVGDPAKVCAKVAEMVATIQANYNDDGGNFLENVSCTQSGAVAKLDYDRIENRSQDDGGDPGTRVHAQRDLAPCARDPRLPSN